MTKATVGTPDGRRASLLVRMGNAARDAGVVPRRIHLVVAGPNPLAPTKLTDLVLQLEDRRQRGIESQGDRVRCEFVLHPLEPQHVRPGEDRRGDGLTCIGPRVRPQGGQRAQVSDDLGWREATASGRLTRERLGRVEPAVIRSSMGARKVDMQAVTCLSSAAWATCSRPSPIRLDGPSSMSSRIGVARRSSRSALD